MKKLTLHPLRSGGAACAVLCAIASLASPLTVSAAAREASDRPGQAAPRQDRTTGKPRKPHKPQITPRATLERRHGEDQALDLTAPTPVTAAGAGEGGGLLRPLIGLAIVVALIFAVQWALRKVQAGRGPRAGGSGLAPLGSLSLGPNRSVHLVRAGEDVVLLGVSEKAVVGLRTWTGEEASRLADPSGPAPEEEPAERAPAPGPLAPRGHGGTGILDRLRTRTVRG